jgi:hypothetical protein
MSPEEKITEIMTLAGVAQRDFKAARPNFERLNPDELDRRLEKLRAGSAKIDAWRATRGFPSVAHRTALAAEKSLEAAVEASLDTVARVDRNLKLLADAIHHFEPAKSKSTLLGAMAERRRRLVAAVKEQLSAKSPSPKFEQYLLGRLEAISSSTELAAGVAVREMEQVLRHPIMPAGGAWLGATDTIEALARIENAIAKAPPDLLVAVNEGLSICFVIKSHLGLTAPIRVIRGSEEAGLRWDSQPPLVSVPKTIWVIGHVARTGGTLIRAIKEVRELYSTNGVFGAVLAASIDAANHFARFSFHQLAESTFIELTFDASKQTGLEQENFILGGERSNMQNVLPVSRLLLDRARQDMARRFNDT